MVLKSFCGPIKILIRTPAKTLMTGTLKDRKASSLIAADRAHIDRTLEKKRSRHKGKAARPAPARHRTALVGKVPGPRARKSPH